MKITTELTSILKFLSSILLFAYFVDLFFPAWVMEENSKFRPPSINYGYSILFSGWMGFLTGEFRWISNLIFLYVNIQVIRNKHTYVNFILAIILFATGISVILDAPPHGESRIAYKIGAYVWAWLMLTTALICLSRLRYSRNLSCSPIFSITAPIFRIIQTISPPKHSTKTTIKLAFSVVTTPFLTILCYGFLDGVFSSALASLLVAISASTEPSTNGATQFMNIILFVFVAVILLTSIAVVLFLFIIPIFFSPSNPKININNNVLLPTLSILTTASACLIIYFFDLDFTSLTPKPTHFLIEYFSTDEIFLGTTLISCAYTFFRLQRNC